MKRFTKLLISVTIMLALCSGHTLASTTIQARITAVRIVVVDKHNHILQIYSNTTQDIVPEVRRYTTDGQIITLNKTVETEYQHHIAQTQDGAVGKIYDATSRRKSAFANLATATATICASPIALGSRLAIGIMKRF